MRTSDHRTDVSCFILPSFPLRPTQERRLSCAEGDYSNKDILSLLSSPLLSSFYRCSSAFSPTCFMLISRKKKEVARLSLGVQQ